MTNLVLTIILALFVISEWRYRAKRDGKREATASMLFAGGVAASALVGINIHGLIGAVVGTFLLIIVIALLFIYRHKFPS